MPKMAFYILWKNETDLHMTVGSIQLIFKLGKLGKKLGSLCHKMAKIQEKSQKTQKTS